MIMNMCHISNSISIFVVMLITQISKNAAGVRRGATYLMYYKQAVTNFSRFRDYFRDNNTSDELHNFPRIIIFNIIAVAANATFYADENQFKKSDVVGCHPSVQLKSSIWGDEMFGFWITPCQLPPVSKRNRSFVQLNTNHWSFAYCDLPKTAKISVWNFSIFTAPFDMWTWLLFLLSFCLVVAFSGLTLSRVSSFPWVPTLSAALSLGTEALSRRSGLFILWMFVCQVIPTLYIGTIQSSLISPPMDDVMTEFHELQERNYSLVYPNALKMYTDDLVVYINSIPKFPTGDVIKWLLNRAVNQSLEEVYYYLAVYPGRWVTIGPWYTTHYFSWLQRSVMAYMNETERKKARICHVGEELITLGIDFYEFHPPGHEKLAWTFQSLVYAGIYQRWDSEGHALMHSERVQDRVRVKSKRIILKLGQPVIKALRMERKIVTIFLMWIICVKVCLIAFCSEFCFNTRVEYQQ